MKRTTRRVPASASAARATLTARERALIQAGERLHAAWRRAVGKGQKA